MVEDLNSVVVDFGAMMTIRLLSRCSGPCFGSSFKVESEEGMKLTSVEECGLFFELLFLRHKASGELSRFFVFFKKCFDISLTRLLKIRSAIIKKDMNTEFRVCQT